MTPIEISPFGDTVAHGAWRAASHCRSLLSISAIAIVVLLWTHPAAAAAAAGVAVEGASARAGDPATPEWSERVLTLPAIGRVTAYVPVAPASTHRVALFVSGDGGWNLGVVDMARRIAPHAIVIGVSSPALRRAAGTGTACWYPAGDLETLSHAAQKQLGVPEYVPPVLIGYSSGATLVYAALAAAPPETFAGGISLGFCPDLPSARNVCSAGAWHPRYDATHHASWLPAVTVPRDWYVLHGIQDQVCDLDATRRFLSTIPRAHLSVIDGTGHGFSKAGHWGALFDRAFDSLWQAPSSRQPTPSPGAAAASRAPQQQEVARALDRLGLPLQYRWAPQPRASLLFISGDGGWASLDEGVAAILQQRHVNVIGLSALRYFWRAKAPDTVAKDLQAIVAALARLGTPVFAGGYSFGAAVVPVVLERWPAADRQAIAGLALITPGESASFEIDPLDWIRTPRVNPALSVPAAMRTLALPAVCIVGSDEGAGECPGDSNGDGPPDPPHAPASTRAGGYVDSRVGSRTGVVAPRIVRLPGSHHFQGDYAAVGRAVADFIDGLIPPPVRRSSWPRPTSFVPRASCRLGRRVAPHWAPRPWGCEA